MGCTSSFTLADQRSFHGKYTLGEKLGQGGFGQVRAARLRGRRLSEGGQLAGDCAVKILSISQKTKGRRRIPKTDPLLRQRAQREAAAWTLAAGSEYCVRLHESFNDKYFYYIVMDKCRCSVLDDLERVTNSSEVGIARVFREMLLSLSYLHDKRLVHRDVKLNNFLFGGADGNTVKLCDFGLAVVLPQADAKLAGVCGTAPYKAPEMLEGCGYLQTVDVWSLGVAAYLILFGDFPYLPGSEDSGFEETILRGTPAPEFRREGECQAPSEDAAGFVRALLERSAGARCFAEQALQHPFVLDQPPGDVGVDTEEVCSLKLTIGRARQRTLDLNAFTDPTKQRSVDEILATLQGVRSVASSKSLTRHNARHFSFDFAGARTHDKRCDSDDEKTCPRRLSKGSTHDGSLSLPAFAFCEGLEDQTQSTDAEDFSDDALEELEETHSARSPASETPSWMDMPHVIGS